MRIAWSTDLSASKLPGTRSLKDVGRLALERIAEHTYDRVAISDPFVGVSEPGLETYIPVGVDGLEGGSFH